MDDKDTHPLKQNNPIEVTEFWSIKYLRFLYPSKYRSGKQVTASKTSNSSIVLFKMDSSPLATWNISDMMVND
jgi:hypothetical protein